MTNVGNITNWSPVPPLQLNTRYYWQVVPYNNDGDAENCPIWTFDTYPIQPIPARIVAPVDNSTNISLTQSLSWLPPLEGPVVTGYKVFFGSSYPPSQMNDVGNVLNWTPNPVLQYATQYYWRIVPYNQYGDAMECPVWTFTTVLPSPPLPANIGAPANNSTNVNIAQNLSWTPNSSGGTPTGYRVYLGNNNPPTLMTDVGNVLSWSPSPALQYNLQYFWRVVPYNAGGEATGCPVWNFTTQMPNVPSPAVIVAPSNNSTNIPINQVLMWQSGQGSTPTGYKLYFGETTQFGSEVYSGSLTNWTPNPELQLGKQYFWRVIPFNIAGDAVNCPIWSFTTQSTPPPPPNPALLVEPLNGATNIPLDQVLRWSSGSGSEPSGYRVYFGSSPTPSQLLNIGNVLFWRPATVLQYNTQYFWQITPYNSQGDATDCPVWSFTTETPPPPPSHALLVSPLNNAIDVPLDEVLSWNKGTGSDPTGYKIYFGTSPTPTQPTDIGDVLFWLPTTALQYETRYYWQVTPYNAQGEASGCPVWSFTTILPSQPPPPPNPALNPTPLNEAQNIPLNQVLSWMSGGGSPTGYKVYFGSNNPPVAMTNVGNNTSWTPSTALQNGTTYYWRVVPYNNSGDADIQECPVWSFTTSMMPPPPNPAINPLPADESVGNPLDITLSWQSGGGNPAGYKVYFGTNNPPTQVTDVGSALSYSVGGQYGVRYYWRVVPYNEFGEAEGCPVWVFTVRDKPLKKGFGCTGP
jgi:hypothetical protein